MSIDCPRIECKFHNDPRLLVGVAAIVAHAAAHSGLTSQAQESLAEATMEACEKGLCRCRGERKADSLVQMGILSYPDHVEVVLRFPQERKPKTIRSENGNETSDVNLVKYRETEKSKPAQP